MAETTMDQQLEQLSQAIGVASDASQAHLHQEALAFISSVSADRVSGWKLGLTLFTATDSDGTRKYPLQTRFYALRILESFLEDRFEGLNERTFQYLRKELLDFIRSEYVEGPADQTPSFLRNKLSHTLTLFFLGTYLDQWPSFFSDLFALIQPQNSQSNSSVPEYNYHVSMLFFRLVMEISGEVADQMLKSARTFNAVRHARDGKVRDAVRARDAAGINEAVLTIVSNGAERMAQARKGETNASMDQLSDIVDWGIRTYGSYVGWIDINLTVTPTSIPLLFTLLSDPALEIRLSTCNALLRMVTKGLKDPTDKLQLFQVLSLGQVLGTLEERTRQEQALRGEDTDESEESYREALARLLNGLGLELSKLVEEAADNDGVRSEAVRQLDELRPTMLHFLADPYDDTCSTIFPLFSDVLSTLKKLKRTTQENLPESTRAFISSALTTIIKKMKWDQDQDPDSMDDDDKHAFERFRKGDLRVHLDSISSIENEMVLETVEKYITSTFTACQSGANLPWNEVELAIYLVYIFGDINKSGGKGRAAFCHAPAVSKEDRKKTDYSEYPLTTHGQLIFSMVGCGVANYPHNAVTMQFFETCARYSDFFKVRRECIVPLLQTMVGPRGVHHSDSTARCRVYYLFYKFLKEDKNEITPELATSLLEEFRDTFKIQVEIPELESPDQDLLSEAVGNSVIFDSQLYLFDTAGMLTSLSYKKPSECERLLRGIVDPLMETLSSALGRITSPQDVVDILLVHHSVMALGSVAKGFPELPSPLPADYVMPPIEVFRQMMQAIIVSLEAMGVFEVIREATRFAIGRIVSTAGSHVVDFIPKLMSVLLGHFVPTEMPEFLTFLGLFMHRFSKDIFSVVDQLIIPLHLRVVEFLAIPVEGTDDKITYSSTKRAYLTFLSNALTNGLSGAFLTDGNKPQLEAILGYVLQIAEDSNDSPCQKLAFTFFTKCTEVWAREPKAETQTSNGTKPTSESLKGDPIPGFEQFVYERIVPCAFRVPASPDFNAKDGQMLVVLHEISTLLKTVYQSRGMEFPKFLVGVFLPSVGCPPETAADFASKVAEMDQKSFRKYFTDFVRASKQPSVAS